MNRLDLIRHPFNSSMRLIEIGASYNPIIPKADGWNTTIIDHAPQEVLREKYQAEGKDRIEQVDFVWTGEPLDRLLPEHLLGQFDGLIASHVGEHITDFVGFFQALDRVLSSTGVIALALPDLRTCFDFFQPRTTTGDLLDAHEQRRSRHPRGKIFDVAAYRSKRLNGVWSLGMTPQSGVPVLEGTLADAMAEYQRANERNDEYTDTHGSQFTPSSFRLIILELFHLNLIPWTISRLDVAAGVEFYVWLERSHIKLSPQQLERERYRLLQQTLIETASEQLGQLGPVPSDPPPEIAPVPAPVVEMPVQPVANIPTISAIVPLYNGQRYIEGCLQSIIAQSLQPLEIIVVNDGSTDQGPELVSAMIASHPAVRIVLLHKDNGGQSSARNLGAQHARGDLLACLDQDDRWYAAHLEEMVKPFIDPPPGQPLGWVYSDLDEADGDGRIIHHNFLMNMPNPQHPKRNLYTCMDRDMYVLPSASLISRAAFQEIGGFDERLAGYEDDDLFLRMFYSGKQNVFLKFALSKWCMHDDSASFTPRMRRSRMIYCRKLLEMFPDKPEKNVYYSRDTILPRFYNHARTEYRRALVEADAELIEETMNEMRFLLDVAVKGDGINTLMTRRQARKLQGVFNRMTPMKALRKHRLRRRLKPLSRRLPPGMLLRAVDMMPLYG